MNSVGADTALNFNISKTIRSIESMFYRDYKGHGSTASNLIVGSQYIFIWAPRSSATYTIAFSGATVNQELILTESYFGREFWCYLITATSTSVEAVRSDTGSFPNADGAVVYLKVNI